MAQNTLKAGLVQMRCRATATDNLAHITQQINAAADQGVRLILLQELHNTPYFCQTEDTACFDLSETVPGPTSEALSRLAKKRQLVIVASVFERRAVGLYHNTAVVLDSDGSLAGIYRKSHIPDDPGYHEKFYFTPGDTGFTPIETSLGKLGVLVCWDQWYPEAARLMALAGAELLLYPTAIGWDRQDSPEQQQLQLDSWQTVQRGHAIANGVPLMACNRVGFEPAPGSETAGIDFWGSSFVAGPQGELLAQAGPDEERLLVCDIDMTRSEQVRRSWPFLRDRRIDSYDDLTLRFRDT